ncbi:hypothetical protein TNCV_2315191 [Trichonephila clavipes]|nr:hypothetical protein TNCV_2315191 [Trichonephila clavipes]
MITLVTFRLLLANIDTTATHSPTSESVDRRTNDICHGECLAFRLLTGHDCLCAHLFRFNLVTSPICVLCDTGQDMTAAHLDECSALNDLNCIVSAVPGFLPDDRHTASLVGLRGGWRHVRTNLYYALMNPMLLCLVSASSAQANLLTSAPPIAAITSVSTSEYYTQQRPFHIQYIRFPIKLRC